MIFICLNTYHIGTNTEKFINIGLKKLGEVQVIWI